MLYLWLKAFHIVSIVCWFAGLFYLPRLFVYHAQSEDSISKERFSLMERVRGPRSATKKPGKANLPGR